MHAKENRSPQKWIERSRQGSNLADEGDSASPSLRPWPHIRHRTALVHPHRHRHLIRDRADIAPHIVVGIHLLIATAIPLSIAGIELAVGTCRIATHDVPAAWLLRQHHRLPHHSRTRLGIVIPGRRTWRVTETTTNAKRR